MLRNNLRLRARQCGFTLIELLIVTAIVAILVGMLVPAVQRVREASSRTHCASNLKQMALAAHAYAEDHKCLPPSRLDNFAATWAVLLMPYLEQTALYDTWDLTKNYHGQSVAARQARVATFFCHSRRDPSDASTSLSVAGDEPPPTWIYVLPPSEPGEGKYVAPQPVLQAVPQPNAPGALGDYACSIGTVDKDFYGQANGVFHMARPRSGVRFQHISDGLTQTLLIGEKHVPLGEFGKGVWDCSLYNGEVYKCSTRGAGQNLPLAQSPTDTAWAFGGYHPGLCQFAFADGSVHRLLNSIDPTVLGHLAGRSDGQVVAQVFE